MGLAGRVKVEPSALIDISKEPLGSVLEVPRHSLGNEVSAAKSSKSVDFKAVSGRKTLAL
ncbi:hypothetical protein GCM10028791_20720 [Echinicola sediminis]